MLNSKKNNTIGIVLIMGVTLIPSFVSSDMYYFGLFNISWYLFFEFLVRWIIIFAFTLIFAGFIVSMPHLKNVDTGGKIRFFIGFAFLFVVYFAVLHNLYIDILINTSEPKYNINKEILENKKIKLKGPLLESSEGNRK